MDNADTVGAHFRSHLEELKNKYPLVGDVRGMGLMQGIEFVKDRETKEPGTAEATQFQEECRKNGLLVGKGGMLSNVIRLAPMLNTTKADVDSAIRIMDKSLETISAGMLAGAAR